MWFDVQAALKEVRETLGDDADAPAGSFTAEARAVRRAGELLQQIEPQHGANQNIKEGDHPNVQTRKDAAREAGMSEHQQKQATRVASVPERDFEEQSAGGRVRTWTGNVVSLDEWRRLSEWERHGSTGKQWNGLTQRWEVKS